MGKLEGKAAVITGGSSGIGRATAKEFKEQGARVVITGRDQRTLDEAAREISGDVLAVRADTSSLSEIDKLFAVVLAASEAALITLARTLSAELVGRGIRVNALSPGPVTTPIFERLGLPPEAIEETARKLREQVPMKRFGRPEEIAKTALFLASSDSSFLLGTEIVADGGMSQL